VTHRSDGRAETGARRIPRRPVDIQSLSTPDLTLTIDRKVMTGGLEAMAQRTAGMLAKPSACVIGGG